MDSILQSIEDWFRGVLVSGIMDHLTSTFDSVNGKVGEILTNVGMSPAGFSPAVYGMIENISENVIMPIAGIILTFIVCYELIQLVERRAGPAGRKTKNRREDYLTKRGIILRGIGIIPRSFSLREYLTSGTFWYRAAPSENEVPGDWGAVPSNKQATSGDNRCPACD